MNEAGTTIAAVSTPRGVGGVAVIRISGPDAAGVLCRCFAPGRGGDEGAAGAGGERSASASLFPDRAAVFGRVVDENGDVVDEALATLFRAPRSFTGEDVAEISCHGGIAVTRDVLDAVFAAGAAPAAPGEFTRRAFLNGKLSLSRAEAVGRIISAATSEQRRLATVSARGALSRGISAAADGLLRAVSELWAIVDYPDETVDVARAADLDAQLCESAERIDALAATYRRGRAIADGVRTVIAGRPNVGKSSLYNALCGSDRAIVTSEPGTTRDILETTLPFGGVTLLLADTAGVREGAGEAERIGVDRTRGAIESAELIFAVFDGSSPLTREDYELADYIASQSCDKIALLGKSDLPRGISGADEQKLRAVFGRLIPVSPATGAGLDELEKSVAELFETGGGDAGGAVLFESRQYAAVCRARALLGEARDLLARGGEIDAVGTLAESALTELWSADSRAAGTSDVYGAVSEAVLDDIFSRFCVGK